MTIDRKKVKNVFKKYTDNYDTSDEKIKLKVDHTYRVAALSERIARSLGLGDDDTNLAWLIGMLHDIGRFEQIKRFHSFEPGTMDHAMYGADILFGPEQMIRRFVKDSSFDQLICVAIAKHSDFKLEGIEDKRTLLHARLIRDADKLDNCRVKLEESMETLLDMDEKTVGASPISPKVWESCKAEESVLSADRKTGMDYWMSYLALYFDINFLETYQIIKEQDYIRRIAERVPYSREDTKEKVAYTVKKLEEKMNIQP